MSDYWEDNGIEKPQRVVVCAAIRSHFNGLRICGARHWDGVMCGVLHSLQPRISIERSQWEQGFIDQFGVFMDRVEALAVAKASGQPLNMVCNGSLTELYNEGIC